MSLKQQALQGVIWSAIQKWGMQLISLPAFLILSRLLAPEAFGLVALASVFIAFVEIFIAQGFNDAVVQQDDLAPEHLDAAFWTSLLMGIGLAIICVLGSEKIAAMFEEPELASVVRWLALSLPLVALSSTQDAILRRNLKFKSLSLRSLFAAFAGCGVGVIMAFTGYGVWSLVSQKLVNLLVAAIVLWRVSDWRPRFSFSQKHFKDLVNFGLNVTGIKILEFFNRRSDDFLIGYFLGAVALGYYTVAYRILRIMIMLLTGVTTNVAFPVFSKLRDDAPRMRHVFYRATQYTSLIAFPIFLGMAVLAPEVMQVVFGEKWLPSAPVMQILSLLGVLLSVSYFNNAVIKALGQPVWLFRIMLVTSVFSVIGFALTVQQGIAAVAASFVVVNYLLFPAFLVVVNRLLPLNFKTYLSQYLIPLGASLFMVASLYGLKALCVDLSMIWQLVIYIFGGTVSYLLALLVIGRPLLISIVGMLRPQAVKQAVK